MIRAKTIPATKPSMCAKEAIAPVVPVTQYAHCSGNQTPMNMKAKGIRSESDSEECLKMRDRKLQRLLCLRLSEFCSHERG